MPICPTCKMIGGYHHGWCSEPRLPRVNRIRYPRPNRLGLDTARRADVPRK